MRGGGTAGLTWLSGSRIQDGFPVRNLLLWVSMGGAGPFQWLPDLKRWYRADQARKQVETKDLFFTIAPTDQAAGQVQGRLGR